MLGKGVAALWLKRKSVQAAKQQNEKLRKVLVSPPRGVAERNDKRKQ